MRVLIDYLLLSLLFCSTALGQALPIRNDTPTALRDLGSNLSVGRNFAVDQYGQVKVLNVDPSSGETQSVIPVSNAVNLNGVGAVGVGFSVVIADTVEAASTTTVINATSHVARVGDYLSFRTGTAANINTWVPVSAVTANTITLANALPATPAAADGFQIFRPNPLSVNANSGSASLNSLNVAIAAGGQLGNSDHILKLEDAAAASGDALVGVATVHEAALTATVGATGDYGVMKSDLVGRLIVAPYAPPGETWQSCSVNTTSTGDVAIKAAVASNRIYVTSISCRNTSAVASGIFFKDGSTAIYNGTVGTQAATGGGFTATFPVPLRGTVNTAFNFAMETTSTSTYCCAAGYISVN